VDPAADGASQRFDEIWPAASQIPGWLTEQQARLLWREAGQLRPGGVAVEIGSHQGRSTTVLGAAVKQLGGSVVAIDPFVEGRLFGGKPTRTSFEDNIRSAGLDEVIRLRPEYSTRLRPRWSEPIDLLYVDGKHDYWTCSDDLKWSERVSPEGPVLVHDAYSSIGVTLSILLRVLPSRRLTYVEREGSLALFRVQQPTVPDRLRIVAELPWWIRNVFIKVLLRLRLRKVASALGHEGPYDPY
jgi:Methyltransferase domain